MATNPYAQFGAPQGRPAHAMDDAAAPAAPAAAPAAPAANPYADMASKADVKAVDTPEPLNSEEFQKQLYSRLNAPGGGNADDLIKWSASVGHAIVDNEDFRKNLQMAEASRKNATPGQYGSVQEHNTDAGYAVDPSALGAFFRGVAGTIPYSDEAAAALKPGDYDENKKNIDAQIAIDNAVNKPASVAGTGLGIVGSAGLPLAAIQKGAGLGLNMLRSGGIGAVQGALYGSGAAEPGHRLEGAKEGATTGAIVGAAVPGVVAATKVFAPAVEAVTTRLRRTENTGTNALAKRVGITADDLKARSADFKDATGRDPSLFDILPENTQDFVGSLGRRNTSARGTMQAAADSSRLGLPGRVRTQASRVVSDDTRAPAEVVDKITEHRNTQFEAGMDPLRNTPLAHDPDLAAVLQTDEGRQAVRAAAGLEKDPEIKKQMLKLSVAPKPVADTPERAQIKAMGLSPKAEEAALAQLPEAPAAAEPPTMTLDMADKIARSFKGAADVAERQGNSGRAAVLGGFGQEIRQYARATVPEYDALLQKYGESSAAAKAVTRGEGTLNTETDEFLRGTKTNKGAAALGDETMNFGRTPEGQNLYNAAQEQVRRDLGWPKDKFEAELAKDKQLQNRVTVEAAGKAQDAGVDSADVLGENVSEKDLARMGFKRGIEREAHDPRGALSVADKLAHDVEQRPRTEALLGGQGATKLGNAMAAEAKSTRDIVARAPRTGSRTSINQSDDADGMGVLNALARPSMLHNPVGWVASGVKQLSRMGVSNKVAEDIVNIALDSSPGAAERAIEKLTKNLNGNKQKARFMIDTIRNTTLKTREQN